MSGPLGLGDPEMQRFVTPGQWMNYTVYFENMSNAMAAAQEVYVTNPLSAYLDWSTFEMGEVVFNNQVDMGLSGKRNGQSEVTASGTNYSVRTRMALDNGTVQWYLRIVDPATQDGWPADPYAGFLPPNDPETHRGEGHLSYRVRVRADAPHNARIDSSATIVFDYNDPITTDPSWWNTVTENASVGFDGAEGVTNVTLVAGLPYGELPEPERAGHTFGGWWTEPGGTGTRVTAETVVPEGGGTLHALWVVNAFFAEPGGEDAAPPSATTAYEGFAYDDGGTVRGTVTLSAKAAVKKVTKPLVSYTTNWTVTAKAILQNATVSFSDKGTNALETLRVETKTHEVLNVALGTDVFHGTLSGGKAGEALNVIGARNAFADKKDAAAQERLAAVRGAYNVALVERSTLNVQRSTLTEIVPAGYLALTVGNAGAVKLAGKLAEGSAVSGSAKLLEGLNAEGWLAVALHKPLYAKKGFIGGLLWLNPQDKVTRVDATYGWCVDWVCEDPKKGTFEKELEVGGGAFVGRVGDPSYFGASVPPDLPAPVTGLDGEWKEIAFPWELPLTVNGTKWSLPKATPPKKVGKGAEAYYDYTWGANPSGATLAYTAKTGLFKGAFKLYYDGFDARGALQHKTVSVSYTGVVTPVRDEAFAEWPVGLGVGTATINRKKETIPVFLAE
jgi:uncharacterized repeat protein (TIGR01451 family)